jgi:sugar lactone lactonase YvrE
MRTKMILGTLVLMVLSLVSVAAFGLQVPDGYTVETFASGFVSLHGIVVDVSDNLFVCDTGVVGADPSGNPADASIIKISPSGDIATIVDGYSADFLGITVGSSGDLFVSHAVNGPDEILRVSPDGSSITTFASLGYATPRDLAFDSFGNLFVGENDTGDIKKITPDGQVSRFVNVSTGYHMSCCFGQGLSFDVSDNLFISRYVDGDIIKITPDGVVSTFISGLSSPQGIAFDSSGNLFVAETGAGNILKIAPTGDVSTFASGLSWPRDLAFDSANNLFVIEGGTTILKISPHYQIEIPFAAFTLTKAKVDFKDESNNDKFEVKGEFTLGEGNNGIDPVSEDVVVTVGTSTLTIPAGSFTEKSLGKFEFEGTIDGAKVEMEIKTVEVDVFVFKVEAEDIDLTGTANPVNIYLLIGNDYGDDEVRLDGELKFELEEEE